MKDFVKRSFWLRKDQGSMIEFVYVLSALVIVTIICIIMMDWYSDIDKKTKVEMISREYILRMESRGFLSEEDQEDLIRDLMEWGLTNISLAGTTIEAVEYGNKLSLCINGSIEIKTFRLESWMHLSKGSKTIPVSIQRVSTAKN